MNTILLLEWKCCTLMGKEKKRKEKKRKEKTDSEWVEIICKGWIDVFWRDG